MGVLYEDQEWLRAELLSLGPELAVPWGGFKHLFDPKVSVL